MPYSVKYLGRLRRVVRVEAHITPWAAPPDSEHGASSVMYWTVTVHPNQDEAESILVDKGNERKVVELYKPDLETGSTERIFDGTTLYRLTGIGWGNWNVELRIKAQFEGGQDLVTIKSVLTQFSLFANAKGPDPALPGADKKDASVFFQHTDR